MKKFKEWLHGKKILGVPNGVIAVFIISLSSVIPLGLVLAGLLFLVAFTI